MNKELTDDTIAQAIGHVVKDWNAIEECWRGMLYVLLELPETIGDAIAARLGGQALCELCVKVAHLREFSTALVDDIVVLQKESKKLEEFRNEIVHSRWWMSFNQERQIKYGRSKLRRGAKAGPVRDIVPIKTLEQLESFSEDTFSLYMNMSTISTPLIEEANKKPIDRSKEVYQLSSAPID